jgi:signal transduction histidine kinase
MGLMNTQPPRPAELTTRALRLAAAGAVGASVVHELRNALAVVSSSLYLARRDRADAAKLDRHLDKATLEVQRAQSVVAAVLGLARGEALAREPTPVATLIAAARGALVLPTNVTFSIAIEPHDLSVMGDPILLERVLSNLYLNAIEALAGRGRGAIATSVRQLPNAIEFVVEDDGPGIDPSLGIAIFDPLVTTKEAGTGLGLALVRAVAEAHGGSVFASPRVSAEGARFCVLLPI